MNITASSNKNKGYFIHEPSSHKVKEEKITARSVTTETLNKSILFPLLNFVKHLNYFTKNASRATLTFEGFMA